MNVYMFVNVILFDLILLNKDIVLIYFRKSLSYIHLTYGRWNVSIFRLVFITISLPYCFRLNKPALLVLLVFFFVLLWRHYSYIYPPPHKFDTIYSLCVVAWYVVVLWWGGTRSSIQFFKYDMFELFERVC